MTAFTWQIDTSDSWFSYDPNTFAPIAWAGGDNTHPYPNQSSDTAVISRSSTFTVIYSGLTSLGDLTFNSPNAIMEIQGGGFDFTGSNGTFTVGAGLIAITNGDFAGGRINGPAGEALTFYNDGQTSMSHFHGGITLNIDLDLMSPDPETPSLIHNSWVALDHTVTMNGTIKDFNASTAIVLSDRLATSAIFSGGDLLAFDKNNALVADYKISGANYASATFSTTPDGTGGTIIQTNAVACFASGTRIDTPDGPVAVEDLREGGLVLTYEGETRPIVWLGHRHIDFRLHPAPETVYPVRVRRGAFGPGRPERDLFLSPDHAVYVDGVLIPIRYLIDGDTIQTEKVDFVTYWHVELPEHDTILANGLPAESYLDTGDRDKFNAAAAHPRVAAHVWETMACAPLVRRGPLLERARAGLVRSAA